MGKSYKQIIVLTAVFWVLTYFFKAEGIESPRFEKNVVGSSECLLDLEFIGSNYGWMVGWGGKVFHTKDGGKHWISQDSNTRFEWFTGVTFIDKQHGWICGSDGSVLKTEDGGETWSRITIAGNSILDIQFVSSEKGWICCLDGKIMYSKNGGLRWTPQETPTRVTLKKLFFLTEKQGWVVGDKGTILVTNDGGINWVKQSTPTADMLLGSHFLDEKTGWVCGINGVIMKLDGKNDKWVLLKSGVKHELNSIYFINKNTGYAVGGSQEVSGSPVLLKTNDGGRTWDKINIPFDGWIHTMMFIANGTAFMAGTTGTVLHVYP